MHLRSDCIGFGLLVSIVLLIAFDAFGIFLLRKHGVFYRLKAVADINAPELGARKPTGHPEEKKWLLNQLQQAGLDSLEGEEQAVMVMAWVMNQVVSVGKGFNGTPYELLKYAQEKKKGLLCYHMATIYAEALAIMNVSSRVLYLYRNMYDIYDSHAIVEVNIDNKWHIYDSTFNLSFKSREKNYLLNAQEMMKLMIKGNFNEAVPLFYGEVKYPARFDVYYLHYMPLYNNVIVSAQSYDSFFSKIPPFRYFFGPSGLYEAELTEERYHIGLQKTMYAFFILILPVLIITNSILLLFSLLSLKTSIRPIKCDKK